MKGVKNRPSVTPGGLKVVSIYYAQNHNKYFAIAKQGRGMSHSTYVIETLKKNGQFAKRQVSELWNTLCDSQGDAKDRLRQWDLR